MSSVMQDNVRSTQHQGDEWRQRYESPAHRREFPGLSWGVMATGLVVAGLAIMAWSYLGPDVRRYIKIQSM
jgi:hypothetical protein